MTRLRLHAIGVALALGALASGHARAEGPANEDVLVQRGLDLRRAGRDAEALVAFQEAYALHHSPRALGQIALAEEALSLWVDAERDLTALFASGANPWTARYDAELKRALVVARAHLARLEITGGVPGGEIWCDGAKVGTLPLRAPLRVPAGTVQLRVLADGYEPWERAIELAADGAERVTIALVARDLPPPEPTVAPPAATSAAGAEEANAGTPAREAGEPIRAPAHPSAPSTAQRTAGWITLGAGGVFFVGATLATVKRADALDRYNDPSCDYGGIPRSTRCAGSASDYHTYTTLTIVGYAATGLAVATGAALLFTAPRRDPTAAALWCAPGAGAVACGGRF